MRALLLICVSALLTISCSSSRVELQAGGKLTVAERQNLTAIHSDFADWEPSQSAIWSRHGVTRHICLREGGIGSLTMPYWAVVFDDSGRVVEANIIQAPNPGTAEAISSVSPLRVIFRARDEKTCVCAGKYSQTAWQHEIQKEMDLLKRLHEIVQTWRQSGSTNLDEADRLIEAAIKNSRK